MSKFDERTLPISIDPDTKEFITADDIRSKRIEHFLSLENLDEESFKAVVIERIKRAPELKLAVLGGGYIGKEQSLKEVMSGTSIGKDIIEIERRAINMTLKHSGE